MTYQWKLQEIGWAVAVAVVTSVLVVLVDFDPASITDWQTYAVGLGAGAVRAAAAAAIAAMGRQQ